MPDIQVSEFALELENLVETIQHSKILGFTLQGSFIDGAFDTLSLELQDVNDFAGFEKLTRPLEPITFRINGYPVFIGRIQSRSISDTGVHSIECSDYRADLVQGYVDPGVVINKGISLEKGLLSIGEVLGITEIEAGFKRFKESACPESVSNNSSSPFDISKEVEQRSARDNEGAYQLMLAFCERAKTTIQPSDSRTTISIAQPSYEQKPTFYVRRTNLGTDKAFSNVTGGELQEDYSEVPTVYVSSGRGFSVRGQATKGLSKTVSVFGDDAFLKVGSHPRVLSIIGELDHNGIPKTHKGRIKKGSSVDAFRGVLYRPRYITNNECRTQEELDNLANTEISASLKKVFSLTYELPDIQQMPRFGFSGGLLCYDTVMNVKDEVFGLDGDFYVASRSLSYSSSGGTSASVQLILPHSYLV